MKVIARKGLRVPMETGLRRYVTDAAAIEVPSTAYYRRRISDGDLITDAAAIAKQEAAMKTATAAATAATPVATITTAAQATGAVPAQDAAAQDTGAAPTGDKTTAKGA